MSSNRINVESESAGHKRQRTRLNPSPRPSQQQPRLSQATASSSSSSSSSSVGPSSLVFHSLSRSWLQAAKRARTHPEEAQYGCTSSARAPFKLTPSSNQASSVSTPLAMACRYGAPPDTVEAILQADVSMVRRCIPNRGTPLHEAIMAFPKQQPKEDVSGNSNGNGNSSSYSDSNDNSNSNGNGNDNMQIDKRESEEHEAYNSYVRVIRLLLRADEHLASANHDNGKDQLQSLQQQHNQQQRATRVQDVDGNVPLHLLVRQGFYNYLGTIHHSPSTSANMTAMSAKSAKPHPLLHIIRDVIQSCPQACATADFTEYEETPLVLVLKGSIFAIEQRSMSIGINRDGSRNNNNDYNYNAELELRIFEVCKLMLEKNVYAASFVASKSKHTAVHSAVFHGRCCDTIRLLLKADYIYRKEQQAELLQRKSVLTLQEQNSSEEVPPSAAMRANQFGETPLHFATMRGECTRTIELLSREAPWAVLKRDVKFGMTPLHWLGVRFVDVMYEQFGKKSFQWDEEYASDLHIAEDHVEPVNVERGVKTEDIHGELSSLSTSMIRQTSSDVTCPISAATTTSDRSGNDAQIMFDLEYHRRTGAIEMPVDYMRMRHILPDHLELEGILMHRVGKVLMKVRERHRRLMANAKKRAIAKLSANAPKSSLSACCPRAQEHGHSSTDAPLSKSAACPHRSRSSSEASEVSVGNDAFRGDTKKCPFRCPFVFDSYPIDPALMGLEEEAVREEQVISLFWAKVTSLLHAATVAHATTQNDDSSDLPASLIDDENVFMLHSACSAPSPLAIIRLCVSLYPEQLLLCDQDGKLPLHHAACRKLDIREFNKSNDDNLITVPNLIGKESSRALVLILNSGPVEASRTYDNENRLPFHHAIDSVVSAVADYSFRNKNISQETTKSVDTDSDIEKSDNVFFIAIDYVRAMIRGSPETVEKIDGRTGLYPFMQVSATASECLACYDSTKRSTKLTLSLTYALLLENPSLASAGLNI